MKDPLIGLGQIIKVSDDNPDGPQNKVINIMFALGASGTGKTTRYIGYKKKGGHPEDEQGILNYIINNNNKKNDISMAYFVNYGRKEKYDNTNYDYKDTLIFFKNDDTKEHLNNVTLSAYNMKKNDTDFTKLSYTSFYVNLMDKKLCEIANIDAYTKSHIKSI